MWNTRFNQSDIMTFARLVGNISKQKIIKHRVKTHVKTKYANRAYWLKLVILV